MTDLTALYDVGSVGPEKAWRCYGPACLSPDKSRYSRPGCTHYCSRPQLAGVVANCMLPPPPPPPTPAKPPVYVSEVFVPGELGYPCIRIPSIILGGDNSTLLAFAECRNFTGDGCLPVASPAASVGATGSGSRNANRDLCQKRSLDGGATWGPLAVIARNGAQASPVWDAVRSRMLLQYMQLSPPDTMQMVSADHGLTWTKPKSVCAGGMSGVCGGAVGPGVGIQLTHSKHAGRMLFIGHFGAYMKDRVWFTDDGGATFSVSSTVLAKMDEAQLVELPDGRVRQLRHHFGTISPASLQLLPRHARRVVDST